MNCRTILARLMEDFPGMSVHVAKSRGYCAVYERGNAAGYTDQCVLTIHGFDDMPHSIVQVQAPTARKALDALRAHPRIITHIEEQRPLTVPVPDDRPF